MQTAIVTTAVPSLRDLCVLVSLKMGAYGAVVTDRAETDKINLQHGAAVRAHKVSRDRLAGTDCGAILERIRKAQTEARDLFRARTLPWDDNGRRMCGNDSAADLLQRLGEHDHRIGALVAEFCAAWPLAESQARNAMNGGWRPEYADDYRISPDEIRARFTFDPTLEALPAAEDIRINAPDAVVRQAREAAERATMERFEQGIRDVHARLIEAIGAVHRKLSDPEAIYRDSLFGNLRELIDLLPVLNITRDPALDKIGADARRRLLSFDLPAIPGLPPQLPSVKALAERSRDDMAHRKQVADAAGSILRDLSAFMA